MFESARLFNAFPVSLFVQVKSFLGWRLLTCPINRFRFFPSFLPALFLHLHPSFPLPARLFLSFFILCILSSSFSHLLSLLEYLSFHSPIPPSLLVPCFLFLPSDLHFLSLSLLFPFLLCSPVCHLATAGDKSWLEAAETMTGLLKGPAAQRVRAAVWSDC